MAAQGRLGDKAHVPICNHGCPGCPHPAIGPGVEGSPNVKVNGRPALRMDDPGMHGGCCMRNDWNASGGSATVFINGKPAHRRGDKTDHCGGPGKLREGSSNVETGGPEMQRQQLLTTDMDNAQSIRGDTMSSLARGEGPSALPGSSPLPAPSALPEVGSQVPSLPSSIAQPLDVGPLQQLTTDMNNPLSIATKK